SDEDAGLIPAFWRDSMPPAYLDAFSKAKVGDVVRFAIPGRGDVTKQIVAQVTEIVDAGTMTLSELKEQLRNHLAQVGAYRRYLDKLRNEFYVAEYRDRMYAFA